MVIDVIDETYVLISGPNVKRRKCNIKHLEFHPELKEIEKDISDEEVKRAMS